MKKTLPFLLFPMLLGLFASCSTKVDIYADYKDVAIIYAMLDYRADTNYVKICRAFCGLNDNSIDANEIALIADSCNYPGKLDARIIELIGTNHGTYSPTGRVILLDTMTIHNKAMGTFYAPDQKIYYTTERFHKGTEGNKYKYRLIVVKPDGDTVTAQTGMVGNEEFSIITHGVNFQMEPSDALRKVVFKADDFASLYNAKFQFNYSEQKAGQEMEWKHVDYSFGTKPINEFPQSAENNYCLEFSVNWLFNALSNAIGGDTVVDVNHPNVIRHIGDFVVSIGAGGDALTYYYLLNQAQQNSPISLVTTYTNVDGGYGLFSSRTTIEKVLQLSYGTKRELFAMSAWGFKEQ